jgi:hypothetical protein
LFASASFSLPFAAGMVGASPAGRIRVTGPLPTAARAGFAAMRRWNAERTYE